MRQLRAKTPRPDELWLSRPPYLMTARILEVEERTDGGVVSYELCDEGGAVLEQVHGASLDQDWWRNFRPLVRRQG
jgi:hypothetical protein